MTTTFNADSWQNPGVFLPFSIETHDDSVPPNPLGTTGCAKLGFAPKIESQPTTNQAGSASGPRHLHAGRPEPRNRRR